MKNKIIEVRHVSKIFVAKQKYPGLRGAIKGLVSRKTVAATAVDDISFEIAKGEIVGYIGSNGAGKSTTIKMMTGIIAPTKGECLIAGIDPRRERMKNAANIGVVFGQRTQLWWDLPLSESFSILKEIYQVEDEQFEQRMRYLKELLGLDEFFRQPVRTLSLGQRMRADFAAALLHQPKVLFLDEPTIGLDVVVKTQIRAAIKELNEKYHTTVILTTHDLEDIEELCQRIIIIDKGKKIYDGRLAQLKEQYGKFRRLTVEVKRLEEIAHLTGTGLAKRLGVPEKACLTEVLPAEKQLRLTFDRKLVPVPQVLAILAADAKVVDISIQDVELSDIIREIYEHGLGGTDEEKA